MTSRVDHSRSAAGRRRLSRLFQEPLIVALGLALAPLTVSAADPAVPMESQTTSLGAIVGVLTDRTKAPVAHATVTATKDNGSSIRATVSAADGTYSFADLTPGKWSLAVRTTGTTDSGAGSLTIKPGAATRYDVTLTPQTAATSDGFLTSLTRAVGYFTMPDSHVVQTVTTADNGGGGAGSTVGSTPPPAPTVPLALTAPDPSPPNDTHTPLANLSDTGWVNGNTRETTPIFDTKFFTPEIRFDMNYLHDFNDPHDHTIVGSTEEFRSDEFQIEQVSFGGNFHWDGVQARFLSMMGLFSTATIRNDASNTNVGQWDLADAYRYFSEANAGYHWDYIGHGSNVDAGIFVSYIGLFSHYTLIIATYPSRRSCHLTRPGFFNGLRVQYWPTQNLKIEPGVQRLGSLRSKVHPYSRLRRPDPGRDGQRQVGFQQLPPGRGQPEQRQWRAQQWRR